MTKWTNSAVFYHIYPLGFCAAPKFHEDIIEHRIQKIKAWIPHIKQLNCNAVYIGPVFESSEHGYDTSDYRIIDHRLGTNEDFKEVCDALHEAGIRIVLDGVFNHVGRLFWAFQDVIQHKELSPYCGWFHNLNFYEQSPFHDPFTYEAWEGHYNLVKLNLENPDVVHHLLEAVGQWIDEFHIDGLRLDAADCINPSFFKQLKQYCKMKKQDFWLMGEIIHGDYNRWANDEMLDSVTNYECYKGLYSAHNEKNYFEIAHSIQRQSGKGGIYENLCLYNFVDNHDVNRLASTLTCKQDLYNVYTLLYTMPGIPSIYYGSEWGIEGKKHDGSDADIRPSLLLEDEHYDLALCEHIAKLGSIRKQSIALCEGSYEQILIRNEQLLFKRISDEDVRYIALNLSDSPIPIEIDVPHTALQNILDMQIYEACNGKVIIILPPKNSCILKAYEQTASSLPEAVHLSDDAHKDEYKHLNEFNTDDNLCKPDVVVASSVLKMGRYEHYKGKHYTVLYVATHSETLEPYVVYRQLYGNGDVWIRPLSMFQEMVEVQHKKVPRFRYIGK